ncbi:hypothetical protein PILCRDRAFT_813835 [Piloderma croceum F 1598]|uniref:Uncharacterized protein n=1 Tax=Piloderma croceum (strain F 1598) TaxID=765440 RepID=A0A0C3CGG8_PILCF|nr:hypothetical protein PILCRDRAFT_813835 [Piloderma croceum F 1598]
MTPFYNTHTLSKAALCSTASVKTRFLERVATLIEHRNDNREKSTHGATFNYLRRI